jgi:predicted ABC-type transport system involved in lysophospholipase L1 biosynthesis ATPase subunit
MAACYRRQKIVTAVAVRESFQTVPTTRKIEVVRTPIDLTAHSANSRQQSAKSHPGAILLSRFPASSSTEAQHMGLSLFAISCQISVGTSA